MSALIDEIKTLIIETLNLEDVTVADIDDDAPLFGEGLGLDSIDALELGVALHNNYGLTLSAEAEEAKQHFASVRHLAAYIEAHRNR
ncbi:MAG: phosphopantetheine-binding protein [Proteobacteria bacterium]|nr:phosphopantetheine-binding protein [Pseudomonadota bacterium]MCL2309148.1 phosphopantetheine-binding protein [Pseudomonadota bacterium]